MPSIKYLMTLIFCFSMIYTPFSQSLKKADKAYAMKSYKEVIKILEQKDEKTLEDMERIAHSYRLNHDTENAEFWYAQIIVQDHDPINTLYYAEALQSNEKYQQANRYFTQYNQALKKSGDSSRKVSSMTAMDNRASKVRRDVIIKNEVAINSEKLDFSPTYFKKGILFVSSRGTSDKKEEWKDEWIDDPFMSLFYAPQEADNEFGAVEVFSHQLNSRFHEGPVSFSKNKERIFFTRNDFIKGKRNNDEEGIMKLQIYTSLKDGQEWTAPKSMPFNTTDYEECHPALNETGDRLYFSSNRPGGLGGMDIYYSDFAGGKWSAPVNMGQNVNTPGNDLFPFIHQDGTLYFASGGWPGLGGLDIFSTRANENGKWTPAKNMGAPFNSSKDDFGFVLKDSGKEGFFSSARLGGIGKDDIYSFTLLSENLEINSIRATVCAFEQGETEKMAGVAVKVKEVNGVLSEKMTEELTMKLVPTENDNEFVLKWNQGKEGRSASVFKTNEEGSFVTELMPGRDYVFIAEKEGYTLGEKHYSTKGMETLEEVNFCIPLKKVNCLSLKGTIRNEHYDTEIPNATLTLINLCTGETSLVRSDEWGEFDFPCVACGCDFILKGSKDYFQDGEQRVSTLGMDCAKESKVSVVLDLVSNDLVNTTPVEPVVNGSQGIEASKIAANLSDESGNIALGKSIELENIYYDFDRSRIRSGARVELDKVVNLLYEYPSMILELSSHTDCRGTNEYNQRLSQKRADAAVNYMVSKGIDRQRLVAKGYGEGYLRNACVNNRKCSEEEHQHNRRTEIKVLYLEEDVEIN